jgi:hypothetical protein
MALCLLLWIFLYQRVQIPYVGNLGELSLSRKQHVMQNLQPWLQTSQDRICLA